MKYRWYTRFLPLTMFIGVMELCEEPIADIHYWSRIVWSNSAYQNLSDSDQ